MEVVIKRLKEERLDDLYRLIRKTIYDCYKTIYPSEVLEYFLSYNQPGDILEDMNNGYSILVYADEVIVGSGTLLNTNIRRVFVLPEFQKNGIGRMIIEHLENNAKSNGLSFVELYSMMPSVGFYEKLNYKSPGICYYYTSGNVEVEFQRMEKLL